MLDNLLLYNGYTVVVQAIKPDKVCVSPVGIDGKAIINTGRYVSADTLSPLNLTRQRLQALGFDRVAYTMDMFKSKDLSLLVCGDNFEINSITALGPGIRGIKSVHELQNICTTKWDISVNLVDLKELTSQNEK